MKRNERFEAKRLGLKTYFTGKPCLRGHIVERCTANGSCHQCFLDRRRSKRSRRPGYQRRAEIAAQTNAPTRVCAACHTVQPATSEFFVVLHKQQPSGTITTGLARECRPCRKARFGAWHAADAVPPWVDLQKIRTIYALADFLTRTTGVQFDVDHYYPLRHPDLCGLHVPWNLRVIPTTVNKSKRNRRPEDFTVKQQFVHQAHGHIAT